MAGKVNRIGTSRPSSASRVAATKAARAAAVDAVGGVRRAAPVDEVSRPESPASIAMKSLELDGVKAADLKVRVEANERALDDLQKVQSKAGDIADKAAEGDFPFGGDQSVVTVKPLPRSSTAASVVP